jgi:SAM-dependent methyltransferase
MLERALDLISLYETTSGPTRGRDFLEIGTGWCPWVPLLLRLTEARRIVTVDVNPWLSIKTAVRTTEALLDRAGKVGAALRLDPQAVYERLRSATSATSLAEWLAATEIAYHGVEVQGAGLPAHSVDAVLSSNVLEHVAPSGLRAIHRESARILRPGGVVAHRFNPQDHFSEGDRTITGANFLQYSEASWRWLGGSGLAYHNRIRCPQHVSLMREAGFEIVYSRTRPDLIARDAVKSGRLSVHTDFAGMTPDELTDDYMWVVARCRPLC